MLSIIKHHGSNLSFQSIFKMNINPMESTKGFSISEEQNLYGASSTQAAPREDGTCTGLTQTAFCAPAKAGNPPSEVVKCSYIPMTCPPVSAGPAGAAAQAWTKCDPGSIIPKIPKGPNYSLVPQPYDTSTPTAQKGCSFDFDDWKVAGVCTGGGKCDGLGEASCDSPTGGSSLCKWEGGTQYYDNKACGAVPSSTKTCAQFSKLGKDPCEDAYKTPSKNGWEGPDVCKWIEKGGKDKLWLILGASAGGIVLLLLIVLMMR